MVFDESCQKRDLQESVADHMAHFTDHTVDDAGTERRSNFRLRWRAWARCSLVRRSMVGNWDFSKLELGHW